CMVISDTISGGYGISEMDVGYGDFLDCRLVLRPELASRDAEPGNGGAVKHMDGAGTLGDRAVVGCADGQIRETVAVEVAGGYCTSELLLVLRITQNLGRCGRGADEQCHQPDEGGFSMHGRGERPVYSP